MEVGQRRRDGRSRRPRDGGLDDGRDDGDDPIDQLLAAADHEGQDQRGDEMDHDGARVEVDPGV